MGSIATAGLHGGIIPFTDILIFSDYMRRDPAGSLMENGDIRITRQHRLAKTPTHSRSSSSLASAIPQLIVIAV